MSHRLKSLKQLSCITIGLILSTAFSSSPASAKQFKKLVQAGQVVPGIDQPLERFSDASIGLDQQVAVLLYGDIFRASSLGGQRTEGVYSITKSGKISLVQKGFSLFSGLFSISETVTAPSISQGKIAYATYSAATNDGNPSKPANDSILQVGTPGEIKSYGSIISNARTAAFPPKVSIVNGLVYSLADFQDANSNYVNLLTVLDTQATNPVFKTISTDINNSEIRTGSQSLVVLSKTRIGFGNSFIYKLFERPHDGQFVQLNPLGKNPGSCGFAVSGENVVSCSAEDNRFVLSARFGKAAQFTQIPLPQNIIFMQTPSMSAERVIFAATEVTANGTANVIYLSNKGKAPTAIIRTGDLLDGKPVTGLSLFNNGRAIARKSVIFTARFSGAPSALYRVDL